MIATTPYIGLRSFDFGEAGLFSGRDADVGSVADLVADKAQWRLILLHGMTGAGKSSFLKAGLIPEVTSEALDTEVFRAGDKTAQSVFITAGADPLDALFRALMPLLGELAPAEQAGASRAGDLAVALDMLAPRLRKPLLVVIDQAEEVFTLRGDDAADQARRRFFDFLAEFCLRPNWIQILVSMRTEFFGRFDDELRRRLGPKRPVATYLLQPLTTEQLVAAVEAPAGRAFQLPSGRQYRLELEPGLALHMAQVLREAFPGPGALTALQIVGARLVEHALAHQRGSMVLLSRVQFETIAGNKLAERVIEDAVDQAIGDYCELHCYSLQSAIGLWRAGKETLAALVNPQSEGAPVTRFMPHDDLVRDLRDRIETRLFPLKAMRGAGVQAYLNNVTARLLRRADAETLVARQTRPLVRALSYWLAVMHAMGAALLNSKQAGDAPGLPVQRVLNVNNVAPALDSLVDYLLQPSCRVLRAIDRVDGPNEHRTRYLALGHDVLALGLAEFQSRESLLQAREKRRQRVSLWITLGAPVILGLGTMTGTVLFAQWFDTSIKPVWATAIFSGMGAAYVSWIVAMVYYLIRDARRRDRFSAGYSDYQKEIGLEPGFIGFDWARPLAHPGRLFRHLTDAARAEQGSETQAIPGRARF